MWLSLVGVILILAITFFQAIQGFFSAFIMTVLTILAAATAFGFSETLYDLFLWERMPEYAHTVGFLSIFVITLLVMRTITDSMIRSELEFPALVHKVGGGLCGFATAMVMVGVVMVGIQMLPFDKQFLGFERETAGGETSALLLKPDGFVTGMFGHLSAASLSGEISFRDVHPNFEREISRNRIADQREARQSVNKKGTMSSSPNEQWVLTEFYRKIGEQGNEQYEPIPNAAAGHRWWAVRVHFDDKACDMDDTLRFTPAQVRLVRQPGDGGRYDDREIYLTGVSDPADPKQHIKIDLWHQVYVETENAQPVVDLVFEVPNDFQPWFIEFKRSLRMPLSAESFQPQADGNAQTAAVPTGAAPTGAAPTGAAPTGAAPTGAAPAGAPPGGATRNPDAPPPPRVGQTGGRVRGNVATEEYSGFSNKLPVALDRERLREKVKFRGPQIAHADDAYITLPEKEPTGDFAVSEFWVPEGVHMFQLGLSTTQAGSTLGRARQFAVRSLKNYRIYDSNGGTHFPIGEWVISDVAGQSTIEFQYDPLSEFPERAVKTRQHIKDNKIKPTDPRALIFLIPPGTKLVSYTTGTGGGRDQVQLNFTAPN